MTNQPKIALLIDADNISSRNLAPIMEQLTHMGAVIIKRVYGNWSKPNLKNWQSSVAEYGLTAIQVFDHISGKNSSDITIAIDAIEFQYTKQIDIFILVTSDSDFTGLANRLVENGKTVIGYGETKTPKSLISACSDFRFLLVETSTQPEHTPAPPTPNHYQHSSYTPYHQSDANKDKALIAFIHQVINQKGSQGQLATSVLGNELRHHPTIDVGKYGFSKIGDLLKTLNDFDVFMQGSSTQMICKKTSTKKNLEPQQPIEITALDTITLTNAISKAIIAYQDGDGWAGINKISYYLQEHYGITNNLSFQTLLNLINKIPTFTTKQNNGFFYVKDDRLDDDAPETIIAYNNEIAENTTTNQTADSHKKTEPNTSKVSPDILQNNDDLMTALALSITETQENGWSSMVHVGSALKEHQFSAKQFGYKNLTEMVKALDIFEIKNVDSVNYIKASTAQHLLPAETTLNDLNNQESSDTSHHIDTDINETKPTETSSTLDNGIKSAEISSVLDDDIKTTETSTTSDDDIKSAEISSLDDITLTLIETLQTLDDAEPQQEADTIDLAAYIEKAITLHQNADGWAAISDISQYIRKELNIKVSDLGYQNYYHLISDMAGFTAQRIGRTAFAKIADNNPEII